jgi:adenylyltransferase/sulfurtransferase
MSASAQFLVLGAGGLGCPALMGLSSIDEPYPITIVDSDRVDASNLQRQVLFSMADVGSQKVEAAAYRLRARRPQLRIETRDQHLDGPALEELITQLPEGSVVLECTDDPGLKFAANDLCRRESVLLVVAGVLDWRGQALGVAPGGACYRCIYEEPPPAEFAPNCADVGVMGTAAGVIGHYMALLALRLMQGETEAAGELFVTDFLTGSVRTLRPAPRPGCPACAGQVSFSEGARDCAASN